MKPIIVLLLGSVLLAHVGVGQQPAQPLARGNFDASPAGQPHLTKFNLDFQGGHPADLLKAIQKGLGKPINAIVPDEYADMKFPALKMVNVDLAELFQALALATSKKVSYESGRLAAPAGSPSRPILSTVSTSFGFRTEGTPSDDSVWYFFYENFNFM